MAPRVQEVRSIYQEGVSESEDDLLMAVEDADHPAPRANTKTGASKSVKSTKSKTASDSTGAAKTATKRKAPAQKPRQALTDRTNIPPVDDNDENDMEDSDAHKAKRTKVVTAARKNTTTKPSKPTYDVAPTTTASQPPRSTIPETQEDPDDAIEHSIEFAHHNPPSNAQPHHSTIPAPRATSLQPIQAPIHPAPRSRSASATRAIRGGGPTDHELRRAHHDLVRKHEDLQLRYEGLEALVGADAESNFARLKAAAEQKARDAEALIAALKKEVEELRKAVASGSLERDAGREKEKVVEKVVDREREKGLEKEVVGLKKEIGVLTAGREKVVVERDGLKVQVVEARNEVKALEAKLVAARQQISAAAQEAKAREAAAASKNVGRGVASADVMSKEAKMKENLYADLTGLIIRAVKQKEGEDEFDCIQTGRNGTLHFHLAVGNDSSTTNPRTPSGLSYEEAEFAYEPVLNEDRDKELLDLLPDYLTEEICFPRNHAQRFYTKLMDSMTKRVVVEQDEE